MLVSYKPNAGVSGVNVVNGIFQRYESPHRFSVYTDLAGTADDLSFENINPIEVHDVRHAHQSEDEYLAKQALESDLAGQFLACDP